MSSLKGGEVKGEKKMNPLSNDFRILKTYFMNVPQIADFFSRARSEQDSINKNLKFASSSQCFSDSRA